MMRQFFYFPRPVTNDAVLPSVLENSIISRYRFFIRSHLLIVCETEGYLKWYIQDTYFRRMLKARNEYSSEIFTRSGNKKPEHVRFSMCQAGSEFEQDTN